MFSYCWFFFSSLFLDTASHTSDSAAIILIQIKIVYIICFTLSLRVPNLSQLKQSLNVVFHLILVAILPYSYFKAKMACTAEM